MNFFIGKAKSKSYFKECHTGTLKVFDDPKTGVSYYGGGTSRELDIYAGHLIVSMASVDIEVIRVSNFNGSDLLKYNNPLICISWPDFDIPSLGQQFWLDLIGIINTEWIAGHITGVTVCCVGGHGRTGTALAIIAGLTGACQSDPVLFIRKNYCEKVVESNSQIKYIEEMTKIKVTAKANKSAVYQSNFNWENDYYGSTYLNDYVNRDKKNERDLSDLNNLNEKNLSKENLNNQNGYLY